MDYFSRQRLFVKYFSRNGLCNQTGRGGFLREMNRGSRNQPWEKVVINPESKNSNVFKIRTSNRIFEIFKDSNSKE